MDRGLIHEKSWEKLNPYGWIQSLHRRLYDHVIPRTEFPVESWVVGSVHVGGVGKTPFVMALIERALKKNKRIGVLSRGYRGTATQTPLWVCDGNGRLVDVEACGDELALIADKFPQTFVVGSASRVQGMHTLLDRQVDLVICDDGFQHLSLKPTRSLVLLPSHPESKDLRLAPMGRCRENLLTLQYADEVWVEKNSKGEWQEILQRRKIPVHQLFTYQRRWTGAQNKGTFYSLENMIEALKYEKAHLFLGLARPDLFLKTWEERIGLPYKLHLFSDHSGPRLQTIEYTVGPIAMTAKDWIKIQPWIQDSKQGGGLALSPERFWVIQEEVQLEGRS